MFFGVFLLITNNILQNECYDKLTYNAFCVAGYLFVALYFFFSILIVTNKYPEKIKRFEKLKYLAVMFLLFIVEMIVIASALPDLD